jgi:hypothetical protein
MRQKYMISRNDTRNELKISEYAITDRDLKQKVTISNVERASFTFLCAEVYARDTIQHSISEGIEALVASLRTRNIYPIEPYAIKIAESVIALYSAPDDGSVELFFDDRDLVAEPMNANVVSG